jgi:hypothetical protein
MTFYVIDKRTGKEPIFDGNHIFRESWCKGRLIEHDIDGWYISEDGQLALVDDCCNMAYPPPDRFEIVYDAPTVDVLEQIQAEIYEEFMTIDGGVHDESAKKCMQIIDKYR